MTLIGSGTITRKLVGSATLGTLAPTTTGGIEIDLLEGGDSSSSFGGESTATVQITVRKDTSANWSSNNPVLGVGEFGYIIDDKQLFVGDGVTPFNSLPNANFIVHLDDLDDSLSGINGSINAINETYAVILTQLNSLDSRTDSLETASSTLSTNLSSEATTRSTADTSLQGQIDDLSGGVMKKYTLQFNASDVPSVEGSPFDIITPTSGTTLVFIAACVSVTAKSPSTKRLNFEFNNDATYGNPINTINITDDINGTTNALIGNSKPFMTIDQTLQLTLINSGVQSGNAQFTLTIFYMEV